MKLITGLLVANITQLSRSLNLFYLKNISMKASANQVSLIVELTRLNTSFWLSLFIPSMCLILAAEITLFINEEHFKATITVALTANLVMYTLYQNVQSKLPQDSKLKLIDMWLLHGLLMPMVVFVILAINELVGKETVESPLMKSAKVGNSVKVESKTNQIGEGKLKNKTCRFVCKALVPITSTIFIITFFIVINVHE